MADYEALKVRVRDLAGRAWHLSAIEARFRKLTTEGIPRKALKRDEILVNKQHILDRIQRRAEEYEFLSHS